MSLEAACERVQQAIDDYFDRLYTFGQGDPFDFPDPFAEPIDPALRTTRKRRPRVSREWAMALSEPRERYDTRLPLWNTFWEPEVCHGPWSLMHLHVIPQMVFDEWQMSDSRRTQRLQPIIRNGARLMPLRDNLAQIPLLSLEQTQHLPPQYILVRHV